MNPPTARYQLPTRRKPRSRGTCIRIDYGGAAQGEPSLSFWFTIEEAEVLAADLARAIHRARVVRAAGSNGPPDSPEPPTPSAAALPAA